MLQNQIFWKISRFFIASSIFWKMIKIDDAIAKIVEENDTKSDARILRIKNSMKRTLTKSDLRFFELLKERRLTIAAGIGTITEVRKQQIENKIIKMRGEREIAKFKKRFEESKENEISRYLLKEKELESSIQKIRMNYSNKEKVYNELCEKDAERGKAIEDYFKFKECQEKKKVISSLETKLKKLKKEYDSSDDNSDIEQDSQ